MTVKTGFIEFGDDGLSIVNQAFALRSKQQCCRTDYNQLLAQGLFTR
ncbi:MAG: hypothetical protein PHC94_11095 [Methylobacter sp.]|nr:hypothetical protein [Methylococcales bacterium]MDD5114554.1 hypothetical protein [Methylobacter sp.]